MYMSVCGCVDMYLYACVYMNRGRGLVGEEEKGERGI